MPYSTATPPMEYVGPINGPRFWAYSSIDAKATVAASAYFTNGALLGMRDGDLIFVFDTVTPLWSIHRVINTASVISLSVGLNVT